MKINIKAVNLDLTPAITVYIEEKINRLEKFVSGEGIKEWDEHNQAAMEADVEIARTTNHHRHGDVYRAEINLKVPGRIIRASALSYISLKAAKSLGQTPGAHASLSYQYL